MHLRTIFENQYVLLQFVVYTLWSPGNIFSHQCRIRREIDMQAKGFKWAQTQVSNLAFQQHSKVLKFLCNCTRWKKCRFSKFSYYFFMLFYLLFSWTLFLNFWHSNIVSEKFRCFLQIVFVSKIAKGGWDWLHTMLVLYSVSVVLWYNNQQNFAHVKRLK